MLFLHALLIVRDIDTGGRDAGIGTSVWAFSIGILNDGKGGVGRGGGHTLRRVRGYLFGAFCSSFNDVKAVERSAGAVVSSRDPVIK